MPKFPTEKQVSSGGVVYRKSNKDIEMAIVLVGKKRRWQLPKGIVDEGETVEETALREVREETGIHGTLIAPIKTIEYWYVGKKKDVQTRFHKFVHFFLMKYESGSIDQHDWEVQEVRWVKPSEAINLLAFKGEKEVVKKVEVMLSQAPLPKAITPTSNDDLLLVSWNINGLRAIAKKGFLEWLEKTQPDMLCLQETKCTPDQLPKKLQELEGYHTYWAVAEKPGYAGTAIYTKQEPIAVKIGMGIEEFDQEGRTLAVEFKEFILVTGYFPNGGADLKRVAYKMRYKTAFLNFCNEQRQKKPVIFCGDLNTAHKAIDVARPKSKKNKSGFLQDERNWIDTIMDSGYSDTFRKANPSKEGAFTCWPYSRNSRERNIGWRLDYIFVDKVLSEQVSKATIHTHTMGSDHCPISLRLKKQAL